jgi:hypothetical protein
MSGPSYATLASTFDAAGIENSAENIVQFQIIGGQILYTVTVDYPGLLKTLDKIEYKFIQYDMDNHVIEKYLLVFTIR